MYGLSLVNAILDKYEAQYEQQQDDMIARLRESISLLLDIFNNQWRRDFQTAKHMLIILSKIIKASKETDIALTLEESKEFIGLTSMFKNQDFLNALKQIHLIINNNYVYRDAVTQMQRVFSGECFGKATTYETLIGDKILSFQRNQQNVEQDPEFQRLKEKEKEAEAITKNADRICYRYRV